LALVLCGAGVADARAVPVVAAAGDIACPPGHAAFNGGRGDGLRCGQAATARLLYGGGYAAVLPLGDLLDPDPFLENFRSVYGATWGRLKGKTYPAIGNHEYWRGVAPGYFNYFNGRGRRDGRAGRRGLGWHSFDLGSWHLISLNANCSKVGCRGDSHQLRWLRRNLREHPNHCVLAYWHQPLFSSGAHGEDEPVRPFWRALYRAGADVVLNGHDHVYERFAPQAPNGATDRRRGIVQFTVGTGGRSLFSFTHRELNSRKRISGSFGLLRLRLGRGGYRWRFIDVDRNTRDSGSRRCRR
jgi:hypothetical protein